MKPNKKIYYDLLVIEDVESWQDLTIQVCDDLGYKYDIATDYSNALKKIHSRNFKAVFINWNFGNKHNGKRLLGIIGRYPEVPVALISGYFFGGLSNLQKKYPNVREAVIKHKNEDDEQDYINELFEIVPSLIQLGDKLKHNNDKKNQLKGNKIMILDQLTTTTIAAGIPFLIAQFTKLTDRLNTEQLKKFEEKKKEIEAAMPVKTEEDVVAIKTSISELQNNFPDDVEIDTIDAFVEWVLDQVDTNFNEIVGVNELIVKILRKIRNEDQNLMNQDDILDMEADLKTEIDDFNKKLRRGKARIEEKRNLYKSMNNALKIIKEYSA